MEVNELKTIIFIGTNKSGSSREATKAAEGLGYFTVLFTSNERQFEQRTEYEEIHKMIFLNTTDMNAMEAEVTKLQQLGFDIKLIVSFVDPYVHVAALLDEQFCQNLTSTRAIEIMEDKEQTRTFLLNKSYSPQFTVLGPADQLTGKVTFPLIIKSPKSTGSKDVLFASNHKELNKHLTTLRNKYPTEPIITEEYLKGEQYLVEVIVHNHQPQIIAVIRQDITKGKRFIITGYQLFSTVPPKFSESLTTLCQSLVDTFELETGAFHIELRLTNDGWKLIEINPRISGGAMNKMIEAAFGFNLVEQTLKLYLGDEPDFTPKHTNFVYTKHLIVHHKGILEKVTGKNRALNCPGIYDVYVKPKKGTILIPPLSMGHRYAYIIAEGATLKEAVARANRAASEIRFHMRRL